jgi:hypothetical protein
MLVDFHELYIFKYTGIAAEVITGGGVSRFVLSYLPTVILPPRCLIGSQFETKS